MMELVYAYDEDGFYTSPVVESMLEELQITRYTKDVPPDYIRAKWNGSEWIEGATEEEIENVEQLFNNPEPSPIETIMEQNAFITKELASAQLANQELAMQNAFVSKELAETKLANQILAEQQGSILLLLAQQINPPIESEPEDPEPPPIEEPVEENIPEEGDGE